MLKTTHCCSKDQCATTLRAAGNTARREGPPQSCSSKVLCVIVVPAPPPSPAFAKIHATGTKGRQLLCQVLQANLLEVTIYVGTACSAAALERR